MSVCIAVFESLRQRLSSPVAEGRVSIKYPVAEVLEATLIKTAPLRKPNRGGGKPHPYLGLLLWPIINYTPLKCLYANISVHQEAV